VAVRANPLIVFVAKLTAIYTSIPKYRNTRCGSIRRAIKKYNMACADGTNPNKECRNGMLRLVLNNLPGRMYLRVRPREIAMMGPGSISSSTTRCTNLRSSSFSKGDPSEVLKLSSRCWMRWPKEGIHFVSRCTSNEPLKWGTVILANDISLQSIRQTL
jgi:hypothetical protein